MTPFQSLNVVRLYFNFKMIFMTGLKDHKGLLLLEGNVHHISVMNNSATVYYSIT